MHGYRVRLQHLSAPYQCQLIRGRPHLGPTIAPQQQGEEYQQHQDDIASHAAPPLIVCAVPGADQEGGSRARSLYPHSPRPATLCRAVRAYPELSALVGPQVPDLRGLFLRGYGSQVYAQVNGTTVGVTSTLHESGQLGQVQGDAIRDIQGDAIGFANSSGYAFSTSGVFDVLQGTYIGIYSVDFDNQGLRFDAARVVPTAAENRPANQAVRYLMRARP